VTLRAVLDLFSLGNWNLETSIITQPANQRRPRCFHSRFRFRILGEIASFPHDFEIKWSDSCLWPGCTRVKRGQGNSTDGKHLSVFLRIMYYRCGMTPTCASCHRRAIRTQVKVHGRPTFNLPRLSCCCYARHHRADMAGARQGETPTTPAAPVGNSQQDISETQLQGREVTPASWAAAKRDLTWTTTSLLKSYLKLLSVVGVSNTVNKIKIDAIAARMRQHRIPLRCLEDAEIARHMLAAANANDYGEDCVV
jgi:hypothetical protein